MRRAGLRGGVDTISAVTRRQFFGTNAAATASLAAQAVAPSVPSSGAPDILFILADQMTPLMTSPYGSRVAKTPSLDRLARQGVVYENAYCNSPLCVPSRASMWTGKLPSEIQSFDNGSEFPAHLPTIPYLLRTAGYRTAVAGKCHFIGADQMHGFDERLTPCIFPAGFSMTPNWRLGPVYNRGTSIQSMLRMLGPSKWNRQLAFDQHTFDCSLERLRQHSLGKREQPLFLTVSFTQPHDPFTTTKEYLDLYRVADIPMPADHGDIRRLSPTYEWIRIHHGLDKETLKPEKIREARRNYLGMISWIDHKVGLLLDELQRLGMDENTVIVFASDHGEMLGEHGQWSKRILLEWASRIPFLIRYPKNEAAGTRVAEPVSLLDLMPTLSSIAGVKSDLPISGRTLPRTATNQPPPVICEYLGEGTIEPMRMMRVGDQKYITVRGHGPQMFDLKKDPEETVNIAGKPQSLQSERTLAQQIQQGWDGEALKKTVIEDQRQRLLIRELMAKSGGPQWDYRPAKEGPYVR